MDSIGTVALPGVCVCGYVWICVLFGWVGVWVSGCVSVQVCCCMGGCGYVGNISVCVNIYVCVI